jgi:hypothetical protein
MPTQDERDNRWRQARAARLRQLPWLRGDTGTGGLPARYVADELLVRDEHQGTAQQVLTGLGHHAGSVTEDEPVPGIRRLRVRGLDVTTAVRRIRARVDGVPGAAAPNHVFLSSPFEHGGPFGPPVPAVAPGTGLPVRQPAATVPVAVLDTGVWTDSPLPPDWYRAGPGDFESTLDRDADGEIDSDVGHANFIAGVLARHSVNAEVRIVKVLDTFGVCTEADLAAKLLSLGDVSLVNLSLGGFTVDDQPPLVLRQALGTLLRGSDRAVVAAAGNDSQQGRPFWPAAFSTSGEPWHDQVVAVAAHDGRALCPWSNTGDWVTLAAPGANVISTYLNTTGFTSGWAQWSGTSFAAPYVAAAIAERVPATGSVSAAVEQVRKAAAAQIFDRYPGLS